MDIGRQTLNAWTHVTADHLVEAMMDLAPEITLPILRLIQHISVIEKQTRQTAAPPDWRFRHQARLRSPVRRLGQ